MTTRRELLIALGGALAAPLAVYAQPQNKIWRVGFLTVSRVVFSDSNIFFGSFRQGMRELGYVEGKNLLIEWRSEEGNGKDVAELASELVSLKVDAIVVAGTRAASAARQSTATIPIVLGNFGDPVAAGFVKSLARPGGNITGLTQMGGGELVSKRLELLLEMVPKLSRLAVLMHPANLDAINNLALLKAPAQKRGVTLLRADASTPQEIEQAFNWMRQQNAGALLVLGDGLFGRQKKQIADLAAKHRLPSITNQRQQVDEGVLMSYSPNFGEQYRRAATFVDKIFKGAKPGDLPIEQPTKFELVINGKTAKALGLTIPYALRISATQVIE